MRGSTSLWTRASSRLSPCGWVAAEAAAEAANADAAASAIKLFIVSSPTLSVLRERAHEPGGTGLRQFVAALRERGAMQAARAQLVRIHLLRIAWRALLAPFGECSVAFGITMTEPGLRHRH